MVRDAQYSTDARPSNRQVALARAAWVALYLFVLVIFSIGQWFLFHELQLPCGGANCLDDTFYLTASEIAELGGRLSIEPRASGGTQVRAWLPLS
jgi:hypothetical protein